MSTPFSDIPKTDSFARTASRFVDLGILKAQGKFRPNDIVTK
ncbi:S-layer homology domain-containing protein [Candidatus Peregrinibacteria bacterium]|nr:S-layer homology domain-containing protein [Candidatus Peregrinibacteria bacterium]MCB9805295.1 S-layer homology domain-containing protein [Candidatus Peribacteria bacterium]